MREEDGYTMGKSSSSPIPELHLKFPVAMVEDPAFACEVMVLVVINAFNSINFLQSTFVRLHKSKLGQTIYSRTRKFRLMFHLLQ